MIGPGKYNELCGEVFERTDANGVFLMVLGGDRGDGTSCMMQPHFLTRLPATLRKIADELERDIAAAQRRN